MSRIHMWKYMAPRGGEGTAWMGWGSLVNLVHIPIDLVHIGMELHSFGKFGKRL